MKKELYKLIRINKNNEYVFIKANSIDLIISIPQNIAFLLGVSRPLILKKLRLPDKKVWDKLKESEVNP